MIPSPYNYVAVLLVVGASLGGAFAYGRHTATVSAERDALERDVAMYRSVETLAVKLRASDEALRAEQQRVAAVRTQEVIKYVDKYRTVVREVPGVVECVDNSGLLDLINATMPTVASAKPAK
ncbi:MAG: hypothetical protein ACRC47_12920 [Shewanella sp.]